VDDESREVSRARDEKTRRKTLLGPGAPSSGVVIKHHDVCCYEEGARKALSRHASSHD
jgi:hypothetical protein